MLFSGRDLWRNGAFAYGGFVFAPGGLEQDGLLLKVLLSAGVYRYAAQNLGGARVVGLEWLTQVLPGWRIKRGDAEFKFYLGPEFQKHHLSPDDPANRLRGNSFGLRAAFDLWYEPIRDTVVVVRCFAVVDCNQQFGTHWLRLAGIRRYARRRLRRSGSPIFRL